MPGRDLRWQLDLLAEWSFHEHGGIILEPMRRQGIQWRFFSLALIDID